MQLLSYLTNINYYYHFLVTLIEIKIIFKISFIKKIFLFPFSLLVELKKLLNKLYSNEYINYIFILMYILTFISIFNTLLLLI